MNKAKLLAAIAAKAEAKGVHSLSLDGTTNKELKEILEGLEALPQPTPQAEQTEADDNAEADTAPGPTYMLQKALITLTGVKLTGAAVTADDFAEGQKTLDNLVRKGHVRKDGAAKNKG